MCVCAGVTASVDKNRSHPLPPNLQVQGFYIPPPTRFLITSGKLAWAGRSPFRSLLAAVNGLAIDSEGCLWHVAPMHAM